MKKMLLLKTLSFSLVLFLQGRQGMVQGACTPQPTPFPFTTPFCDSNPCQNCALCLSFPDQYVCICATGFAGTNCQTVVASTTASTASTAPTTTTTTTTTTPAAASTASTASLPPIPFRFCGRVFTTQKRAKRIVGGVEANPHSFPWQVNINDVCSGSLINKEFVLTTASCLAKVGTSFFVKLGQHTRGTNEAGVITQTIYKSAGSTVFVHPSFNNPAKANDIALIRLSTPLTLLTTSIVPICLPVFNLEFPDGTSASVTGWGQTSFQAGSCNLQQAGVFTVNQNLCATEYSRLNPIQNTMICAANPTTGGDACLGDGGSPLTFRNTDGSYVLGGLTSFGYGCGLAGYPGVYTKVSAFINWIESTPVGKNYNI